MYDSVRSHTQQPAGLLHPWDSPGKNTGVGCHFLLQHFGKLVTIHSLDTLCSTMLEPGLGVPQTKSGNSLPASEVGVGRDIQQVNKLVIIRNDNG